jgi:hypothetical protein
VIWIEGKLQIIQNFTNQFVAQGYKRRIGAIGTDPNDLSFHAVVVAVAVVVVVVVVNKNLLLLFTLFTNTFSLYVYGS